MKLTHLSDIPETGVSHNEEIKKKVLLEKGVVPKLMNFSQATFRPGQEVAMHKHDTMFEIFYIQNGQALFVVEGHELTLQPGDCLVIEQGELHSQSNPFDVDVTWLYFGIATD